MKSSSWLKFGGILLLTLGMSLNQAHAQKKKKEKQADISQNADHELNKAREAEYYFIEGEKYFLLEDYSRALGIFQKSLEMQPNNAAIYYKIAEIFALSNDLDNALLHALRAKKLDGNNKYYYLLVANIYTKRNELELATAEYEELFAKLPGNEEYAFELAAIYMFRKEWNKALKAYERAEKKYGVSEQISLQKQEIFIQTNKLKEAINEAEKLRDSNPSMPSYTSNLAKVLLSNNKETEAIKVLEDYLLENPNDGEIRLLISEVYKQNNFKDKSSESIKIAFQSPEIDFNTKLQVLATYMGQLSDPYYEELSLSLSKILTEVHPENANSFGIYGDILFALHKKEEAKRQYLKVLALDVSNFNVWQNIVSILSEQSKWDSVIYHTGEALTIFPNQASLYYFNGAAHLSKKEYKLAVSAFEMGKKLAVSNPQLQSLFNSQLGDAYNGLKNYPKSDEAYEAALAIDPDNYYVLNNYSYYLSLRKEKLEQAKQMSAKAVKANPENPTYIDTYAWVLFIMGDYEESRKQFEKAIEYNPDGIIFEHYGDVLYKLGKTDQAVIQWQKAKGMNEASELIDKKIADRKLYE